ncbi:MAG TPA: hypothetical protein PK939_06140 [Bacteroidales bacterium]|nr:hypothetical protein [Bacteroidales bacterium]
MTNQSSTLPNPVNLNSLKGRMAEQFVMDLFSHNSCPMARVVGIL